MIAHLIHHYMTLVGWSTRLKIEGGDHLTKLRMAGQHFIYAFWHQRQAFFTWSHRNSNAAVLVSRSRDGALVAEVMRLSQIATCRGSSSRGAAQGARDLLKAVSQGFDIGITPDGPKGPSREVKPGALYLAQKLGIPILPISNALSLKMELKKSWDHFQVPLPFGRAIVIYGTPLFVCAHDDPKAKALELRQELERITRQAEESLL